MDCFLFQSNLVVKEVDVTYLQDNAGVHHATISIRKLDFVNVSIQIITYLFIYLCICVFVYFCYYEFTCFEIMLFFA